MIYPTLEQVRRIRIFSEFSEADLRDLTRRMGVKICSRGNVIFHQGESRESAYFVLEGEVKIFKVSADGAEQLLHIFGPGEIFGCVAFFSKSVMPATAQALKDSLIGYISRAHIDGLLSNHPRLGLKLLEVIGGRLQSAHARISELTTKEARSRIASVLLSLAAEHGISGAKGTKVDVYLTHQDIANWAGTSRETVSRTLGEFRRDGLIDLIGRTIIIKDHRALHNLAC